MIGGIASDGSRYKQPRILEKNKISKEGNSYIMYWVTIRATPIIINEDGKPETPYEKKEYTWFIPQQCIAKTKEYFKKNKYKICFQKLSRISEETGKAHNDYVVGTKMGDLTIFPDIKDKTAKLYTSKKEEIPIPQVTPQVKEEIPFNKYEEDDEVAFEEDIKSIKQKTKPFITKGDREFNEAMKPKDVNVNGEYVLAVLKDIENELIAKSTDIFNVLSLILGELKKK